MIARGFRRGLMGLCAFGLFPQGVENFFADTSCRHCSCHVRQCKSIAANAAAACRNPDRNLAAWLLIMVAVFAINASWPCSALLLLLLLSG